MRGLNTRRDCSAVAPTQIRKLKQKRVYWLVENRSPNSIYMQYDTAAPSNGSDGIEITSGSKYELWGIFAPNNDTIWLTGSNGITVQQVNFTEGYEED
jgi:hypothetical protein